MIKVLIYIPLWRRSKLFETVAASLVNQTKDLRDYEIKVLCCISPEDPERNKLQLICNRHLFATTYYRNDRMGAKMNAGIQSALNCDWHYLMNFGSDDLIHRKLFSVYKPYCLDGNMFFGIRSLYFFDIKSRQSLYYSYRNPTCVGAGRMIHRNIVEAIINSGNTLYTPDRPRSLDANSRNIIGDLTGIQETVINVKDFPYIIDMKSDTNINSYKSLSTHGMFTVPASANILSNYPGVVI